MFTFTPLLGAQSDCPALQSILEFDGGVKILVDVGWDESFNANRLQELEKQVPTLSLILLTHATISHLGAYAHCCKHIPLFGRIPVYATTPVIALGRTLLQDLYSSTALAASLLPATTVTETTYSPGALETGRSDILLPPPTPEEIAEYFGLIHPLNYSQQHEPFCSPFSPPLDGLTITAYCAGHTLGGTIWHIQNGSDSVVYAVDWNQGRENALPGAAWLGSAGSTAAEVIEQLRGPTALICSSKGAEFGAQPGGRRQRDEAMLKQLRETTDAGGSVLLPCDSGARALELAYLLEKAFGRRELSKNSTLSIYFASRTATATIKLAKSMFKWMDESIVREFEAASTRPVQGTQNDPKPTQLFDLKFIKLLERPGQVDRALNAQGPKIFLASDSSMEWGFARQVLKSFAGDTKNLILLSEKPQPDMSIQDSQPSVSAQIWQCLFKDNIQVENADHANGLEYQCEDAQIKLMDVSTSPLDAVELPIYQQYLARQKQRETIFSDGKGTGPEGSGEIVDDRSESSSSSDEDSDDEHQGRAMVVSAALTKNKSKLGLTDEDLGVNVLIRRKGVHDYDVRGRKGREKMFPFVAKRRKLDEFGDVIRPEDFVRAEERGDADGQDASGLNGNASLGLKRKWDASLVQADGKRKSASGGKQTKDQMKSSTRRPGQGQEESDDEEQQSEESDYEPDEAVIRGPTKATFSEETLMLNTKLATVDFSGVHDKRSLQMLIPLIKPRKLVITGGNARDSSALAADCERMFESSDMKRSDSAILMPIDGQTVDASVDTNARTINLSQSLFTGLHWHKFRGLSLVTINGILQDSVAGESIEESKKKRTKLDAKGTKVEASSEEQKGLPILILPTSGMGIKSRGGGNQLHVGDLRLAELRSILQSTGHKAEFKGEGTLLVDNAIAVRKSGIGKIEVECGSLPPSTHGQLLTMGFANVKRKIYEGLALVAAN